MGNVSTMGLLDKGRLSQKERKKRTTLRTTRSLSGDCALHTQMLLHAWHRSIDIYIYIYILIILFFCLNLGKYFDKQGRSRFVGDKDKLQASQ